MKRTLGLRHIRRQASRRRARSVGTDAPDYWRPTTRADCARVQRPCCFVACRYNLFLDTLPEGGIHFTKTDDVLEIAGMGHSCALDVADLGPHSLDDIGELEGLTRERVRQIEFGALAKLKGSTDHLPQFSVARFTPPPSPKYMAPALITPAAKSPDDDEHEDEASEVEAIFSQLSCPP